jgi:hypothetical protein
MNKRLLKKKGFYFPRKKEKKGKIYQQSTQVIKKKGFLSQKNWVSE